MPKKTCAIPIVLKNQQMWNSKAFYMCCTFITLADEGGGRLANSNFG